MQIDLGRIAIVQIPSRGQSGPSQNPEQHPRPFDLRSIGHDRQPPREPLRNGCDRPLRMIEVRIGEDVRVVEGALSDQMLGIDRKSSARTEIQHVVMVQVAVQHSDIAGLSQQCFRRLGAFDEDTAVFRRSRFEIAEPLRQRQQTRRRI